MPERSRRGVSDRQTAVARLKGLPRSHVQALQRDPLRSGRALSSALTLVNGVRFASGSADPGEREAVVAFAANGLDRRCFDPRVGGEQLVQLAGAQDRRVG
jgi:hypothetical protein